MKETNTIKYNGITVQFEVITPEMANAILEDSAIKFAKAKGMKQRDVRQGTVKCYAKNMTEGKWEINGDTIRFDKEGRLMDGQHRLRAIAKSGVSQVCLVVRGIENSVMHTIDAGLKRSLENYLQFQEESYTTGSASIVKTKVLLDNDKKETDQSNGNLGLTNIDYVEEYMSMPEEYKKAAIFAKSINKQVKTLRTSEIGGIYMHLTKTLGYNENLVKDFFNMFLKEFFTDKSKYRRTVDNLSKIKQGRKRIEEYMRCWNAMVEGKQNLPTIKEDTKWLKPTPYLTLKDVI